MAYSVGLIDANVVLLYDAAPVNADLPTVQAVLNAPEIGDVFHPESPPAASLQVDPARPFAPTTAVQVQSWRDRKILLISPVRLEVRDQSGEAVGESALARIVTGVAGAVGVGAITGLGVNIELELRGRDVRPAGQAIAAGLVNLEALPGSADPVSSVLRLTVPVAQGSTYTIAIEPRFNDLATLNIWVNANHHVVRQDVPGEAELRALLAADYEWLREMVGRIWDLEGEQ